MPYALKSGLPYTVLSCVVVDDDGATIRDVASSAVTADMTIDGGVTIGSRTRNGFTRPYFETAANGPFNFHGLRWGTNKPPMPSGNTDSGFTVLYLLAGVSAGSSVQLFSDASHTLVGRDGGTGRPCAVAWGSNLGTDAIPADGTTPYTLALYYNYDDPACEWFDAPEGDPLVSNGTFDPGAFGSSSGVENAIGGAIGNGNLPAKYHLRLILEGLVDVADLDEIADDYVTALFEATETPFDVEQQGQIQIQTQVLLPTLTELGIAVGLVQTSPIAIAATLSVSGDVEFQIKRWRVPTNAPEGTQVFVVIFDGTSPTYTIRRQGQATVDASGYAELPATGSLGTKSIAFVHNFDDDVDTLSIYGGPAIAEIVDVG